MVTAHIHGPAIGGRSRVDGGGRHHNEAIGGDHGTELLDRLVAALRGTIASRHGQGHGGADGDDGVGVRLEETTRGHLDLWGRISGERRRE